jgi:hypothetical protein
MQAVQRRVLIPEWTHGTGTASGAGSRSGCARRAQPHVPGSSIGFSVALSSHDHCMPTSLHRQWSGESIPETCNSFASGLWLGTDGTQASPVAHVLSRLHLSHLDMPRTVHPSSCLSECAPYIGLRALRLLQVEVEARIPTISAKDCANTDPKSCSALNSPIDAGTLLPAGKFSSVLFP